MNSSANHYPIIDTAVHLWDATTYPRMDGDWLDSRPELKRSWLPADLEKELASCQARRSDGHHGRMFAHRSRGRVDSNTTLPA